ncbi:MAG: transposase [Lachnospiraceae bacterium]|nr:transposase [Lachnospiraceae bacterium]
MTTITQDMRYRLSLIKYADKYGVTKAAVKYKTNRQYIYRWKRRYGGSMESLRELSRRPHHHPNQHTPEEIRLINNMRRRNPDAGLVVFWVKLMQRGYTRSIPGLYRFLRRQDLMAVKPPNPKHLERHGIRHKLIRPYTPRHNGKVERSHRKDNERFYATHTFYSFKDFAEQLKRYNRRDYNSFPMRPLGWKSPRQVLEDYKGSV